MRISNISNGLKVQAIAGTYVVTLGINLPKEKCENLLGFSVYRFDHTENEGYYIEGMKCFKETDPGFPAGARYSTKNHPIQDFVWGDYSAKPEHNYTYTITALKGSPEQLASFAETKVNITTESPESKTHEIYFNRGAAGSQEFVRRFGNDEMPNNVLEPTDPRLKWLSRGIYEALELYINSCDPEIHKLRIAAYEFNYKPFLKLLKDAIDKGVDVEIVFDARKPSPKNKNREHVEELGLKEYCHERTEGPSYISHNKFIVKIENDQPVAVWTGGMNFSENGIFGHSNVAHVFKDKQIAEKFLRYWELLSKDHNMHNSKTYNEELTPNPALDSIAPGSTAIFCPRKNLDILELYKNLASRATEGFFMTFAFGINKLFKSVYRDSACTLRFALLERKTRRFSEDEEELKDAEEKEIQDLRNMPANIFAIGNFIRSNAFDGWLQEGLSGLATNVQFIHNKFMMIDPLSKDPIVITGSANFSDASTNRNDENMVIVRGDTRVADIYLGEFIRLWKHHSFRESTGWNPPDKYLKPNDWWSRYFEDTDNAARRKYFSSTEK